MDSQSTAMGCDQIVARLRGVLPQLQERYRVAGLSIFGSCARGDTNVGSDVDLLVEFDQPPGFFKFIELEDELSALLGLRVDLVMKSALRPRIGRRALAEAVAV